MTVTWDYLGMGKTFYYGSAVFVGACAGILLMLAMVTASVIAIGALF